MATSGTTTFNLDILELIEESFERAGLELRQGYDLATARRSLNILMLEWQNRGINLWTVEQRQIPLVTGQFIYTLGPDIIDLLDHVIRRNTGVQQIDYQITRISVSTYATRTNKNVRSRPTEIYIDRQRDAPEITLWPVPESDEFILVYWVLRRVEDVGAYGNTMDISPRFIPAIAAGLAYHIAVKKPEAMNRIEMLKGIYEEQFTLAAQQDREKASLQIVPNVDTVT